MLILSTQIWQLKLDQLNPTKAACLQLAKFQISEMWPEVNKLYKHPCSTASSYYNCMTLLILLSTITHNLLKQEKPCFIQCLLAILKKRLRLKKHSYMFCETSMRLLSVDNLVYIFKLSHNLNFNLRKQEQ